MAKTVTYKREENGALTPVTDDDVTLEDLRKLAAEKNIEGRSSMDKKELQKALAEAE